MVVTPSRQNLVQGVGNDPTSMAFQTITNPSQLTLHNMVGVVGFEPTTPCSQSTCANQAALHTDKSLWKIRSVQYFVCYLSELLHTDFLKWLEILESNQVDDEFKARRLPIWLISNNNYSKYGCVLY